MNFVIIVDDSGELKTVTLAELQKWAETEINSNGNASLLPVELDEALNAILDRREPISDELFDTGVEGDA